VITVCLIIAEYSGKIKISSAVVGVRPAPTTVSVLTTVSAVW